MDDEYTRYSHSPSHTREVYLSSQAQVYQLNVKSVWHSGFISPLCLSQERNGHIYEKLGISPKLYADFKSLTGDSLDNIKGAEKVGPKTAAALINQYGNLPQIIDNADKIIKPSIKESIKKDADKLIIDYRMIKLDKKAEMLIGLIDLEYEYDGISTTEALQGIDLR